MVTKHGAHLRSLVPKDDAAVQDGCQFTTGVGGGCRSDTVPRATHCSLEPPFLVSGWSAAVAVLRPAELDVHNQLFNGEHSPEFQVSIETRICKQLRRDRLPSLADLKQSFASRFEAVPCDNSFQSVGLTKEVQRVEDALEDPNVAYHVRQ